VVIAVPVPRLVCMIDPRSPAIGADESHPMGARRRVQKKAAAAGRLDGCLRSRQAGVISDDIVLRRYRCLGGDPEWSADALKGRTRT
jgi:hypothetical protein